MRSVDVGVGLPFNIASYATLLYLLAIKSGMLVGDLVMQLSHVHIYENQIEALTEQITRKPYPLPILTVHGTIPDDLKGLDSSQFTLHKYQYHPALKMEMVVT